MNSQRLAYFVAVAEAGGVRGAAAVLHVTPAALSRAVKALERDVGVALVEPSGRGIVLTDAGRRLAAAAAPVLASLESLAAVGRGADEGARAVLRYGSHETWGTYFASEVVAAIERDVHVEHHYLAPGALEHALLERVVDAGVTYAPHLLAGTTAQHVGSVAMGVYGRPALQHTPFAALEFAVPVTRPGAGGTRGQSLDGWPVEAGERAVRFRVTHTETALEHARAGRCVAYFARFLVELHNRRAAANRRLVLIDAPDGVNDHRQQVYVVTREGEAGSAAARGLTAAVQRVVDR